MSQGSEDTCHREDEAHVTGRWKHMSQEDRGIFDRDVEALVTGRQVHVCGQN